RPLRLTRAPGRGSIPPMTRLPVGEPAQTSIQEPARSLQALAPATDPPAVPPAEAYAYSRVGYPRGLDRIRHAGWRGTGQVPWSSEGNRGFLRSLSGLAQAATTIGEQDEAERCHQFLTDLAPDTPERGA